MRVQVKKKSRTRKANKYLKKGICECAHAASRTHCQFMSLHKSLLVRLGYKKTTVAVAHKMMRIIYIMLRDDVPYKDPKIDYEHIVVARNASRWKRQLKRYGHLK